LVIENTKWPVAISVKEEEEEEGEHIPKVGAILSPPAHKCFLLILFLISVLVGP
jgi:hypothetical protein